MSVHSLASYLLHHATRLFVVKHTGQGSWKLTVAAVKKLSDNCSAAGGPGVGAVDLNEGGRHHMFVLKCLEHIRTGLHVVMGHVEHVSCREGTGCQMLYTNLRELNQH